MTVIRGRRPDDRRPAMTRRNVKACIAAAIALSLSAPVAFAQEQYPVRPVRVVVAFAPGGGTDVVARSLSARLSAKFGQQFVVDNRPGGGGVTGIELVAKAQPDGQ